MKLHRIDGAGWLQFAVWHFRTGVGAARRKHNVSFGYGINVFHGSAAAKESLSDVKLRTKPTVVAHLKGRRYRSSDARATLLFVFLTYRKVEIEAYYEYSGVAPRAVQKRLRHAFGRQEHDLARLAHRLLRAPKPTATPRPQQPTDTPTASPTEVASPTETPTPAVTDTPTVMPTATETPTPVTYAIDLQVSMAASAYAPGQQATLVAHVTANGEPAAGAAVGAIFHFSPEGESCSTTTNTEGDATCSVPVPYAPDQTVQVTVNAAWIHGAPVSATTSFEVRAG